ncbi:MAG TPA: HigA family addiction module antitoxin [Xanthobacteraceae bacterium]|nr:HigA family addiction module antitoxin [Xanthobacteraceae bacterium]
MAKKLPPLHPGEVLREEFLVPLGISPGKLAKVMDVPRTRVERIANEQTDITATSALLLGKALNTTPQFWLNLQNSYDVAMATKAIGKKIERIEPVRAIA